MLPANIKTDATQKIKELVAASYNFLQKYLLNRLVSLIQSLLTFHLVH